MIGFLIKIFQVFKFIYSCIKNLFSFKTNYTKLFFSSAKDLFKYLNGNNKSSLINKLTGDQHVNVILKKTLENIMQEDMHHKDRKNARKRNLNYNQNEKKRKHWMLFLAFIGLVGCLFILGLTSEMSSEMICIISTAAGIFGSCLKDAYVFEFGSRSDKKKDYFED